MIRRGRGSSRRSPRRGSRRSRRRASPCPGRRRPACRRRRDGGRAHGSRMSRGSRTISRAPALARQRLAERAGKHGGKEGEDRAGEHRATLSAFARPPSPDRSSGQHLQDRVEIEIRARRIFADPHRLVVGEMIRRHRQVVGRGNALEHAARRDRIWSHGTGRRSRPANRALDRSRWLRVEQRNAAKVGADPDEHQNLGLDRPAPVGGVGRLLQILLEFGSRNRSSSFGFFSSSSAGWARLTTNTGRPPTASRCAGRAEAG